jgi:hypothetical protein
MCVTIEVLAQRLNYRITHKLIDYYEKAIHHFRDFRYRGFNS